MPLNRLLRISMIGLLFVSAPAVSPHVAHASKTVTNGSVEMKGQVAGKVSDPSGDSGMFVVRMPLRDVLSASVRRAGMRLNVSPKVKGTVSEMLLPAHLPDMLDRISKRHNIEWYLDGRTVHVAHKSESRTRMLALNYVKLSTLMETLDSLGLSPGRLDLRHVRASNTIIVNGPPSLLARVEAVALNLLKSQNPEDRSYMVIRYGIGSVKQLGDEDKDKNSKQK